MSDLQIREAVPGDVESLAATGQRLFIATYGDISGADDLVAHVADYFSEVAVAGELERDGVRYLLATDGQGIAGFLKMRRSTIPRSVPAESAFEVQQLYVSPDQQRRGIGRQLMDRAVGIAQEAPVQGLWLSVWEDADWAIRFYQCYGFHTVGTADFWLGDSHYNDFLMWLPAEANH
jgi:ribosomal protein S18 acetylase RimI-like enzyme